MVQVQKNRVVGKICRWEWNLSAIGVGYLSFKHLLVYAFICFPPLHFLSFDNYVGDQTFEVISMKKKPVSSVYT